MKDIGWLVLLGVGGYVLYEMFYGASTTTTATTTAGSGTPVSTGTTGATNSTSTVAANQPATSSSPQATDTYTYGPGGSTLASLKAYVHAAALTDSNFVTMASGQYAGQLMGTPYHWNYYVNLGEPSTVGNPLTTSMFAGTNAATGLSNSITEDQFWAGIGPSLASYGLSGLRGLGLIANNVNPYLQGPRVARNQAYGANIYLNGIEKYMIQRSNG